MSGLAKAVATHIPLRGGGTVSLQYGSIVIAGGQTSATATITSVDTTKSAAVWLGWTSPTNGLSLIPRMTLTNSTTVTATRAGTADATTVGFAVVTFSAAASVQTGTVAMGAADATKTTTITSVTVAKSLLIYDGQDYGGGSTVELAWLTLTNSTTVTATRASAVNPVTIAFTVVAF